MKNIDTLPLRHPVSCLLILSKYAAELMGGTSGAIYSLFFVGASQRVPEWTAAWENALHLVMKYSSAQLGHRTMVYSTKL